MTNATMANIEDLNNLGKQVPYSCPDCGGALWELSQGRLKHFRCHTGHAYSEGALLQGMGHALEETLLVALRMLEERRSILQSVSEQEKSNGKSRWASVQEERADEMKVHIDRIREILLPRENPSSLHAHRDKEGEDQETMREG